MNYELNEMIARKVLTTVDAGLVKGVGKPIPGQMCVEAAVCYAMGLPHSDYPACVGGSVRAFMIRLNDALWPSDAARAAGLRKLAVAQLGSERIDQQAFADIVVEQTIRRIVPIALRAAAEVNPDHAESLEAAAVRCEGEGSREAAEAAKKAAHAAYVAATDAATDAAHAAYVAANAATDVATDAARAATDAADYAADDVTFDAAYAAEASARAAAVAERDRVLRVAADIGLQALITLESPGCGYLWLCDESATLGPA